MELTDGAGVDEVIDGVGGDGIRDSIRAARGNGTVAVVGFLDGQTTSLDLMDLIWHQTRVQGVAVGNLRSFRELVSFLDEHEIHPVIDTTYTFEQAHEAYVHLARGAFGKIVIKIA